MTAKAAHIARFLCLSLIAALGACNKQPAQPTGEVKVGNPYVIEGKTYYPEYDPGYDRSGQASWYGPGFHGKFTANGEKFDQDDITAAHPTLPMPSLVRVTNLENGKSVIARINDRGPFKSSRIIDLSRGTAKRLEIHSLARVRVQFLKKETQEYLESVRSGHPISMAELNDRPPSAEIVESTVSSSSGQNVNDAAPVMTVSSNDLTQTTYATAPTGAPVKNIIAPSPPATARNVPEPAASSKTLTEASTDLPAPEPKMARRTPAMNPQAAAGEGESKPVVLSSDLEGSGPLAEAEPAPVSVPVKSSASKTIPAKTPAKAAPSIAEQAAMHAGPVAEPVAEEPVAAAAAHTSRASGGRYMIQVGSFSSQENAKKISTRLSAVGKTDMEQVESSGKSWWRVRLGPFADRGEADAALNKVHSSGAPDARITSKN